MKNPLILSVFATLGLSVFAVHHVHSAVLLDFGSSGDYDNNFVEKGSFPDALTWNAAGYITKVNAAGGLENAIYNSGATGGSSGSGGTTFAGTRSTFDLTSPLEIVADFRFSSINGSVANSFGIYIGVPTGETTGGYLAIWRIDDNAAAGGNADFRMFDTNSNATSGAAGTPVETTGVFSSEGLANTWYTARIIVEQVGGNVQFTASLFNQGGSQIGSDIVRTDTSTPALGGGQVGLRLSATNNVSLDVDNFAINIIPEPSSVLLMAFAGGMAVLRRRR